MFFVSFYNLIIPMKISNDTMKLTLKSLYALYSHGVYAITKTAATTATIVSQHPTPQLPTKRSLFVLKRMRLSSSRLGCCGPEIDVF